MLAGVRAFPEDYADEIASLRIVAPALRIADAETCVFRHDFKGRAIEFKSGKVGGLKETLKLLSVRLRIADTRDTCQII